MGELSRILFFKVDAFFSVFFYRQNALFDVGRWTFDVRRSIFSLFEHCEVSYERRLWQPAASLIVKETQKSEYRLRNIECRISK